MKRCSTLLAIREMKVKNHNEGNSLAVQWLGLPRAQVGSVVRELRSHKPRCTLPTKYHNEISLYTH